MNRSSILINLSIESKSTPTERNWHIQSEFWIKTEKPDNLKHTINKKLLQRYFKDKLSMSCSGLKNVNPSINLEKADNYFLIHKPCHQNLKWKSSEEEKKKSSKSCHKIFFTQIASQNKTGNQ